MKRARFLPLLLLLGAAPLRANTWMNFDTTGPPETVMMGISGPPYYKSNFFSFPGTGETDWVMPSTCTYSGLGALEVGLNYNNRAPTTNANYWGVGDALFFTFPPYDLSPGSGLSIFVYVRGTPTSGNPAYPLKAKFYVKTGNGTPDWYNGETVNIKPNQWTRLNINFSSAYCATTNTTTPCASNSTHVAVTNLNLTYGAGVQFLGADYDSGETTVYLDQFENEVGGLADDRTPPATPGSPSASNAGSGNLVNVSWSGVSDLDLDHYNLYRSAASGFSLSTTTFVTSIPAGTTSLADVSVVDGLTYYYRVTAVDKAGNESPPTSEFSSPVSGPSTYDLPNKAMTYVAWSTGAYSSVDSQSSLDDLMSTGANYVALVVTGYMATASDTNIDYFSQDSTHPTPTDASVAKAIQDIHARGMKVMLKPHVDVLGGSWRGSITPITVPAWFASYQTFINHYADIAQANGVELFCVGTELKTMTDNKTWGTTFRPTTYISDQWKTVISGIKSHYTGPLTYAANTNNAQDEFAQIEFWNQLDYVGLNAWWGLTYGWDPSVPALEAAWSTNYQGFDPLQSAADWHAFTGMPVFITEIGAASSAGANTAPATYVSTRTLDLQEQQNIYAADFAAWNHRPWVNGLFWWHWDPNPNGGGKYNNYYVPNDKPVLQTITQMYGGENVGNNFHYNFEGSSQAWTVDTSTYFLNNLGIPTDSASQPHGGVDSLAYPLSFADQGPYGVQDFAYVEPYIRPDLSGYRGLKAYVFLPSGVVTNEANNPLQASLVLQTGPGYDWCESDTPRWLSSGQWREVSVDFHAAKCINSVTKQTTYGSSITNTQDIRRIGVEIFGAASGGAVSTFYLDDVVARATWSVEGLALDTTSFWLFNAPPLGSTYTLTSLDFENTGNIPVYFSLSCSNASPVGWVPSSTAPGPGTFVLNGLFNSTQPSTTTFVTSNDAIIGTARSATSITNYFSGSNETGYNVPPLGIRNLWFDFMAPSISSKAETEPQTITIGVRVDPQ